MAPWQRLETALPPHPHQVNGGDSNERYERRPDCLAPPFDHQPERAKACSGEDRVPRPRPRPTAPLDPSPHRRTIAGSPSRTVIIGIAGTAPFSAYSLG